MITRRSIRRNIKQTTALIERNIYFQTRFKLTFLTRFIVPFVQILMPLIIFGAIFMIASTYQFGYWKSENYVLFIFIAFSIQFLRNTVEEFRVLLIREKFWKSLQALMVAPLNRYVLLFGILISELIMISVPFFGFLIIAEILYPISLFNIILVLLLILCISIIFGCLGLVAGILIITKEGVYSVFATALNFLFWLSCISYPLQIFPQIFQFFILINPLYYFFDLLRLTWLMGIDYNLAISYITPIHLLVVIGSTILLPIISVYLFNKFYDKYGISGY